MVHASANLTLSIYAREMDRRDGEPERLRALIGGANRWRIDGAQEIDAPETSDATQRTPVESGKKGA